MSAITHIKERYATVAVPALKEATGRANVMAVPRIERVVVHASVGRIAKEQAAIDDTVAALTAITGQKAVLTKARKSIAGFKLRQGQPIGVMVTLRGERMWDFLDRLIHVALPRVRDFQGVVLSAVDDHGNLNIGIREHTVFPEIVAEKAYRIFGLQVTVKTSASTREEGMTLFRSIGVPLAVEEGR